jgi:hypothetical protein
VKGIIIMMSLGLMLMALPIHASEPAGNQISKIIGYKTSLGLTDSQIKKLENIRRADQEKMIQANAQAEIRQNEIEKFSSNWTDMNSMSVMSLIKEYYDYMADYKTAEIDAVIKARAILSLDQLNKFQQLVSIETLMLHMETRLASIR